MNETRIEDYLNLAEHIVRRAKALGADDAEAVVHAGTEFSVTVRKGQVEKLIEAGSRSLGLRVFSGGRVAGSYTADFAPGALDRFVQEAVDLARITDPDPASGLPDEDTLARGVADGLQLYDPAVPELSTQDKIELARRCEAAGLDFDPRITNTDGASFSSYVGQRVLVNSRGFAGSYPATSCSLAVEVMADDAEGKKRNDYWYTAGRFLSDLETPEEVGRRAAERALRKLGARKVPTRQVPVVWDPRVAASFISIIARAAAGDALYRRATFLAEMEGQQVASPLVTIVDDATMPGRLGTRPFDAEGVASRRNELFREGVFRQFLFDSYYARKTGRRTTGNAAGGAGGVTSVGTTNLFLQPGAHSPAEIIASVEDGFYLTDLLGFGENITTGDFSRGAAGIWIEKGELTYPVTEVNVSGNLKDMLRDIEMVGNDLVFRGATAAPTFKMAKLMVSGL